MTWKRFLERAWKVAMPLFGLAGLVLSMPTWPDRWRAWLGVVGMVDSEVARWAVVAVSLVAIASPVIYGRLVAWHRRRKDKRFRNLDYFSACATVEAYIKFSAKGGGPFVTHTIIRKFEELCPEGVVEKAVYNGYLLNSWLRFNAAEFLIRNQNELKGLPNSSEKSE